MADTRSAALDAENAALQLALSETKAQAALQASALATAEADLREAEKRNAELGDTIGVLTEKLSRAEARLETMAAEAVQLPEFAAGHVCRGLSFEVCGDQAQDLANTVAVARATRSELDREIGALGARIEFLEQLLSERAGEIGSLEDTLDERDAHIRELELALREVERSLDDAKEREAGLAEIVAQLEVLPDNHVCHQLSAIECAARAADATERLTRLTAELAEARGDLVVVNEDASAAVAALAAVNAENAALEAKLAEQASQADALAAELAALDNERTSLVAELAGVTETAAEQAAKIADLESRSADTLRSLTDAGRHGCGTRNSLDRGAVFAGTGTGVAYGARKPGCGVDSGAGRGRGSINDGARCARC